MYKMDTYEVIFLEYCNTKYFCLEWKLVLKYSAEVTASKKRCTVLITTKRAHNLSTYLKTAELFRSLGLMSGWHFCGVPYL